ncbi:MAG: hypothetical protein IKO57_11960 [Treponema sp.]|nr:hypothetical protein [Treponema sp.]MBR6912427.1 hypothetical protein [Treponema sp.]
MASINRYQSINDIPESKGRDVLLKILTFSAHTKKRPAFFHASLFLRSTMMED